MKKDYSIGVFDSGVGGTTVLKIMAEILPHENMIYYADSGNAPYGKKTVEELQSLCFNIMDFFLKNRCKAVVIACNTATAAALTAIKERYDIPVIGVIIPGSKAAANISKNGHIAVLATPFTANSNAYGEEIKKFAKKASVYQEGCSELCTMIEEGWETFEDRGDILDGHISQFPGSADTLVLGCTHYPIIREDIEKYFSGKIVDPAKETVIELIDTLRDEDMLNNSKEKGKIEFFVSGDKEQFRKTAEKFLGFEVKKLYQIEK